MLRRTPRRSALLPIRPEVGVDLEGAAVRVTQPIGGLEGQADVASVAPLLEDVRQADQLELVADAVPRRQLLEMPFASLVAEDVGGGPPGEVAGEYPTLGRVQHEPIPGRAAARGQDQRGLVEVDRLLTLVGEGDAHERRAVRVSHAVLPEKVPKPEVESLLGV